MRSHTESHLRDANGRDHHWCKPLLRWERALACVLFIVSAVLSARGAEPTSPVKVIYVIPSAHWDLGFLRPPLEELDAIKPHLDAVIQACAADPQFRWTIESVWQLQAWLDRTKDAALIDRLAGLLRSGQVELSAADGSMHSEFMGSEELNRLVYAAKSAEQRFGIHATVAMMNDVPGFSIRLPQVLARSGVRYLITGSNIAFGGGTSLTPGKMPIYWRSPDGSQILMWQTQGKDGGYTEAMADYYIDPDARDPYLHTRFYPKEWDGLSNLEIMHRGIQKLLGEYAAAGYQHSLAALLYMHDGIGPEYELHGLLPNVRAWNAAGNSPRIVVATPSEFFAAMEREGGFPTYTGDWSGLWSAVKLNSPAMSADARWLQEQLPRTETLWSLVDNLLPASIYPVSDISADYGKLFLYDEHNGSGQGGWPKLLSRAEVQKQNLEYARAVQSARASVTDLLAKGVAHLASAPRTSAGQRLLLVYNPTSWTFSGFSSLSGRGPYTIRDAKSGQAMKTQSNPSGTTYFEVQDVPPLGYRTYSVERTTGSAATVATAGMTLRSRYFEVEFNRSSGEITRIIDQRAHRVLLDAGHDDYAGQLMAEHGNNAKPVVAATVKIHHERGPLFDFLRIERPGSYWPETIISLPLDQPRIDLEETLDRTRMPFVASGTPGARYSFGFRFAAADDSQRLVSDGEELYHFPEDLLPGAKSDAVVPRHTIVWDIAKGDQPYQLMLAQQQSFFDELPSTGCRTASTTCPASLRAVVMLKSDQAETRDQGIVSFDSFEPGYSTKYSYAFSLTGASGNTDPVAAQRFDPQDTLDSVVLPPNHQPKQWVQSLLSLSAPNVVVEVLKPSRDGKPGDLTLRLREISGTNTMVSMRCAFPITRIAETTMTEDRELATGLSQQALRLSAYQTLTLRLTRDSATNGQRKNQK
jgi:hypothetical protein